MCGRCEVRLLQGERARSEQEGKNEQAARRMPCWAPSTTPSSPGPRRLGRHLRAVIPPLDAERTSRFPCREKLSEQTRNESFPKEALEMLTLNGGEQQRERK